MPEDTIEIAKMVIKLYENASSDDYAEYAYKAAIHLAKDFLALQGRIDKMVDTIDDLRMSLNLAREINDDD